MIFGGVVELDRAEEVAVVGHGDGGHLLFGDDIHQLADLAGAVEEGVVGVAVEVDEGFVGHPELQALVLGEGSCFYFRTVGVGARAGIVAPVGVSWLMSCPVVFLGAVLIGSFRRFASSSCPAAD